MNHVDGERESYEQMSDQTEPAAGKALEQAFASFWWTHAVLMAVGDVPETQVDEGHRGNMTRMTAAVLEIAAEPARQVADLAQKLDVLQILMDRGQTWADLRLELLVAPIRADAQQLTYG